MNCCIGMGALFIECDCNANGTQSCNKENGQCLCKPHVIGKKCDSCKDGYYGYLPNCLVCPKGWITRTSTIGKCYHPGSDDLRYLEAKDECELMASKLAEPLDLAETEFIYKAASKFQTWIGINDLQVEDV